MGLTGCDLCCLDKCELLDLALRGLVTLAHTGLLARLGHFHS